METNRKELEQLLRSLKPSGLRESTLDRLEQAMCGTEVMDPSMQALESQIATLRPRALSDASLEQLLSIVRDVPFALDRKVVFFPGARKEVPETKASRRGWQRVAATAAVAAIGALAALWTPVANNKPVVVDAAPRTIGAQAPVTAPANGIVATSFGTGVERAEDEGVIWTPDHQPKRVLRFEYQDRVLVRDKNGVDRMLFIPREELFVVPEKVD